MPVLSVILVGVESLAQSGIMATVDEDMDYAFGVAAQVSGRP